MEHQFDKSNFFNSSFAIHIFKYQPSPKDFLSHDSL